ncbi:MAG: M1 family peptidase [Phycisphaera sp.]|nr:MAG: M1 family peptidase [Phycisphaera sp.]
MNRVLLAASLLSLVGCATTEIETTETNSEPQAETPQSSEAEQIAQLQRDLEEARQQAQEAKKQAEEQEEQRRQAQAERRRRGPEFGAVDDSTRRITGETIGDIFAPLDLPTANEMRLGSGAPGTEWWQQRCDYIIDARLDPESRRLEATMKVTYHNNSPHDLDYVWLQLEQNLFKPDSLGTLSRTPGSVMSTDLGAFDGGYTIPYIRSAGSDLDFSIYDTLARVDLDEPIGSGETFEFELAFGFNMPPHLRRMGAEDVEQGTIFEYAQWFPHVTKYDDVNGWNTLPYIGNGEFYTDFGDYEVSITVPRGFLVEGTGVLQNPEEVLSSETIARLDDARQSDTTVLIVTPEEVGTGSYHPEGAEDLTWAFSARDVRTFAFATSNAFIWDACTANITELGGTERAVLCQSFYPKEAEAWYWNREWLPNKPGGSTQYIKHSIEFYSDWLYPYPYQEMSNINGAEGGMEYPGIIFCGAKTNDAGLFGVTDHEVGHNWYPMLVNTDERRYMWMDEGFNSFINMYSNADYYGEMRFRRGGAQRLTPVMNSETAQASNTPADRHWPRWVGTLNYSKPAWALYLLREVVLGPERFDTAWKSYTHRWAYKHPQPADFFRSMEDASGTDLAWFWRGWFLSAAKLDQGIAEVSAIDENRAGITLVNEGDMVMPVMMEITYDDESTERIDLPVQIWGAANTWRVPVKTDGKAITKVVLDPNEMYPEITRKNNIWESESNSEESAEQ